MAVQPREATSVNSVGLCPSNLSQLPSIVSVKAKKAPLSLLSLSQNPKQWPFKLVKCCTTKGSQPHFYAVLWASGGKTFWKQLDVGTFLVVSQVSFITQQELG